MEDWSAGQVIVALILAVLVPGIVIHFTLGRNGGHHMFDDMSPEERRNMPIEMAKRTIKNRLIGGFGVLVGLAVAVGILDLSESGWVWGVTLAIAVFVGWFIKTRLR
jgi:hypothetical protein